MSLVISLGSNIGDRFENLRSAKTLLCKEFKLEEESRIYSSPAVDYLDQPDFLNQVLSFESPNVSPQETLKLMLSIEHSLGRRRDIPKGPRNIDIDMLFFNENVIKTSELEVPHPRLFERSFIVLPLKELKIFNTLNAKFDFPETFCNEAFPLTNV